MDRNAYLIRLSESDRTDHGRIDFVKQSADQQVFSAIWALESEVNNGGFTQYFTAEGDSAAFAPTALECIGARQAAAIVRQALALLAGWGLSADPVQRAAEMVNLSDAQENQLSELDSEFCAYPDNLTDCLFEFVSARPESFGLVPSDDEPSPAAGTAQFRRHDRVRALSIGVFVLATILLALFAFAAVLVHAVLGWSGSLALGAIGLGLSACIVWVGFGLRRS